MVTELAPAEPGSNKPIRLLLVEDHLVTRLGLKTLLSGRPQVEVVGEAGSVADALSEIERCHPDVLLLDVRLPDGTAYDVCRQLLKLDHEVRVLILTSYADDETLFEAIAVGADGYLLKEIDADGLLNAIENVAAGRSILDPAVTRRVLSRVRPLTNSPEQSAKLDSLSLQERKVLSLVAQGKTNKEIAAAMGLSDKTVKNYLSNTLGKLQVSRRSQAAAVFVRSNPPGAS